MTFQAEKIPILGRVATEQYLYDYKFSFIYSCESNQVISMDMYMQLNLKSSDLIT